MAVQIERSTRRDLVVLDDVALQRFLLAFSDLPPPGRAALLQLMTGRHTTMAVRARYRPKVWVLVHE